MGAKTGIEWTDSTWNPFIGCSRVSEGCRHCYAERMAGRFSNNPKAATVYSGTTKTVNGLQVWAGKINRAPEGTLLKPLSWKKPRRIFVNSMSDLFHENVPDEWIDRVFAVMALCQQHTFQVLTKRPERMLKYLREIQDDDKDMQRLVNAAYEIDPTGIGQSTELWSWPLPNVWLGVSCENQATADERIPLLIKTPTAVRFISAEPLLGAVDLRVLQHRREFEVNALTGDHGVTRPLAGRSELKLDWVIVGGESGPGARPMHPDWARSLRDQCTAAGVPFFFKQWGDGWRRYNDSSATRDGFVCGTHHGGTLLDGREWKQFPEPK